MRRAAIPLFLALSASIASPAEAKPRNVAIVIYEGAEILDFAGPAEVLKAAGSFGTDSAGEALVPYTVARTRDAITAQGFIRIVPQYSIADAPRPDVIVIPGGNSSALSSDKAMMEWLLASTSKAEVTLTVCTGAFPLAEAGRFDGMEITTWYGAIAGLQEKAPKAHVKSGRRFVDNGKYITTAGVSAGIDGALHLVARLLGRRVADQTARYMEYHWTPEPYLSTGYAYWNPSTDERGRAGQRAAMAVDEKRWPEAIAIMRKLAADKPSDGEAWMGLGWVLGKKGDRAGAIAAYKRVPASSPRRGEALVQMARELVAAGDRKGAVRALTDGIAAGFSREHAMHDPALAALLAPRAAGSR
jgi:putative intracellular protease/amidase